MEIFLPIKVGGGFVREDPLYRGVQVTLENVRVDPDKAHTIGIVVWLRSELAS